MHVAVVTGHFPTVSETFVLDQITGLVDAGHKVTVIASAPRGDVEAHDVVEEYGLLEQVVYWSGIPGVTWMLEAGRGGLNRRILSELGELARVIRDSGESVFRLANRAVHLSRTPRFDAILCHFGHVGLICEVLRALGKLRGPLATVFHGWDMSAFVNRRGDRVYDRLFEKGDLLLPISEFWRRRLVEMGAPKEKVFVQRMGVDPERFSFRKRRSTGKAVRILTVGRLVEKKGIRYGIEAFARLADDFPNARYRVIGDGPLREELEDLCTMLGAAKRVEFVGWRTRAEVKKELGEHHLLVAPSVRAADGDMEGIPVVLMEAMATGMPVVSTRHSGIPELVADGESGILVEERDVAGLAEALRRLLEERESWGQLGQQGRQIVEKRFSVGQWNRTLVERLEEMG